MKIAEKDEIIKKRIEAFSEKYVNKLPRNEFSKEAWKKCGEFGIIANLLPKEMGGMAESIGDIMKLLKWIGYYFNDNGFVFSICNSLILYLGIFPKMASKKIKEEFGSGIIQGKYVGAYAITEANSGSDAYNMGTSCKVEEDKIVINGSKMYISNGSVADLIVVVAKNAEMGQNRYTAILVKRDDKGVKIGKTIHKMGLESCMMSEITFNNCVVPRNRVIGTIGMGSLVGNMAFDWEKCISFSTHLGKMNRIMNDCIEYANQRKQFGKSIGEYQMISEKIAKMKVAIELGEAYLEKIISIKESGKITFLESSVYKYYVGESYAQLCLDAMQIYGAYGYSKESGIEKEVRDSLGAKIYSGTSEMQLYNIAKLIGVKG